MGAGIRAEHLAGYRALPDRCVVVALCDLDRARAWQVAGPSIAARNDLETDMADPGIGLIDDALPLTQAVPFYDCWLP